MDTAKARLPTHGLPGPARALTLAPRHFNYVE